MLEEELALAVVEILDVDVVMVGLVKVPVELLVADVLPLFETVVLDDDVETPVVETVDFPVLVKEDCTEVVLLLDAVVPVFDDVIEEAVLEDVGELTVTVEDLLLTVTVEVDPVGTEVDLEDEVTDGVETVDDFVVADCVKLELDAPLEVVPD